MTVSLVKRIREIGGRAPETEFVPSDALVRSFKHARRLNRNVRQSSVFSPRLHRRASEAAVGVRALDAHERRAFKENT